MGIGPSQVVERPRPNTRPFGQITIEADPRAYYEEETVTGNVYLNLHRHYAKSRLTIKFKGREMSHFIEVTHHKHGNDDFSFTTTRFQDFQSEGTLDESTFTIHKWDDLQIGQHVVPFSIKLPKGLYSSFDIEEYRERTSNNFDCLRENDKDTYKASVLYQLTARLESDGNGPPALEFDHQLNIRQTPPKHNLEQSKTLEVPAMSFFFWNRGKTFLNVNLERDFASYGETLPVKFTIDNSQSSISSGMVTVKLIQNLCLKAQTRTFNDRIIKYKKRFEGVPAGKISQENLVNIELMPGGMSSSVDLGLVRSSYELEISVGDDGCGGPANKCVIPINIGCGNGVYLPIEIPHGWNPSPVQVLNTALQVGSALERAVDAGFAMLDQKNGAEISANNMINHNALYKPLLGNQSGNQYY